MSVGSYSVHRWDVDGRGFQRRMPPRRQSYLFIGGRGYTLSCVEQESRHDDHGSDLISMFTEDGEAVRKSRCDIRKRRA
ncbi:ORF6 [Barthadenovirus mellis]|uniref:ORF6 n=1 Tax=Passerine adenovirus 1 TaxID=2779174 RepID=A0A7M4BDN5_9ADEN|nr:ORF6 [Passerine adenovirus 1]